MNTIQSVFDHRKAYLGYLTAGQGGLDYFEQAACALVKGGVDMLEIGLPFSDPVADGPAIQAAMDDALSRRIDFNALLSTIHAIKIKTNIPLVLFSYFNPLLSMGLNNACQAFKSVGVDAVLIVDLPLEERAALKAICCDVTLDLISLLAPSTHSKRAQAIEKESSGFLYYVCRHGVTGVQPALPKAFDDKIAELKAVCQLPIVCGFGIADRTMARQAIQYADGFVVGSAFVNAIQSGATANDLYQLAQAIDPRN